MAVKELVDKYESGRGSVKGNTETTKRILLVDSYSNWREQSGVPSYGDEHPDNPLLKVSQIDYEGYGSIDPEASGLHKYTKAKLTVHYSSNPVNEFTFSRFEMGAELFEVGGGGTFATAPYNKLDRPYAMPIAIGTLVLPRRSILNPMSDIMAKLGYINLDNWTPDGYTYPPERVWFAGASVRKVWDSSAGAILYESEYTFKINVQSWNMAWDGAANRWDVVLPKRYPSTIFTGFPG